MLCIKLLVSYTAFFTIIIESNKCLAMSFTAQYDDLNRNKASTALPLQVGVFTAAASIQINQPKPKHIENLQTILLNITIFATSISLEWKFWVITKTRVKRSGNASVVPERRSLEWVIKVRQFGTLNVNIYHVTDEENSIDDILVHNTTYNYTIKGLEPLTPYELCIHSKHHTITDSIYTVINSKQSITQSNRNYDICKEIVTLSSNSDNISEIAMASAISSASTTIVIVVMFCCCRRGSKRDTKTKSSRQHKHRRSIKYQRIWKWLDKSPQRSSLSTSSNGTNIKQFHLNHAIIPVVNHSDDFVTYIDPNDIKCITGKKVRIFSRIPKPLSNYTSQMRNNISTTSKFKIRYGRPNSWPQIDSNKVYNKSNSNPSLSNAQNNKLWFRSMSSGVKLNNSISNVDFV